MQIEEVLSKKQEKDFLKVPKILYKDDPIWVCPLDKEIESIFIPGCSLIILPALEEPTLSNSKVSINSFNASHATI